MDKDQPKNTLETRLENWLETQGYPLEMRVERMLRKSGLRTFPSDYYIDPQSKDSREIDIYAVVQHEAGEALVRISMCIECKSSKDKPWVLFTSEDIMLAPPARVAQRASSHLGKQLLMAIASRKDVQKLKIFSLPPRPAFGLTQAFTSGNDVAYSACLGVSKCAFAKSKESDKGTAEQGPIIELIFPVIVMDGRMFENYLDGEGKVVIKELKSGVLLWRNQLVNAGHTIIRVTTEEGLSSIVEEIQQLSHAITAYNGEIDTIMASHEGPKWKRNR